MAGCGDGRAHGDAHWVRRWSLARRRARVLGGPTALGALRRIHRRCLAGLPVHDAPAVDPAPGRASGPAWPGWCGRPGWPVPTWWAGSGACRTSWPSRPSWSPGPSWPSGSGWSSGPARSLAGERSLRSADGDDERGVWREGRVDRDVAEGSPDGVCTAGRLCRPGRAGAIERRARGEPGRGGARGTHRGRGGSGEDPDLDGPELDAVRG